MLKLDHLTIPVSDWNRSRDWYAKILGLTVEFGVAERLTGAMQDENDFTVFLEQSSGSPLASGLALTFQVADVQASFEEISRRGCQFLNPPSQQYWGYGAELRDPDGYLVRLWDQKSMEENG